MKQSEIKYLLAVDGGGTKTEFLLTNINKEEISRLFLGPSNPIDIGIENTKKILNQGICEICKDINLNEISAFVGLAGGMTGNNKQQINDFLKHFDFGCFGNGSDTENVLEIALEGSDGVAVIMGTGIIAFTQFNGNRKRIGGWGYLIDKGGSGYNIGSDAMYIALKYIDGRNGSKLLCELIEDKLGKSLPDSIAEIHQGGKAYIASFAPIVFEAYEKGDKFAAEIIESNIKEVAEIIIAGENEIPVLNNKVVICGGLNRQKDTLDKFLKNYLGKAKEIIYCDEPIVNGALMIAEKIRLQMEE